MSTMSDRIWLCGVFRLMLQNSRPTLADVSCSASVPRPLPVPRLTPLGSLSLDDLSHLTAAGECQPIGRGDVSSDGGSSCSDLGTVGKTQVSCSKDAWDLVPSHLHCLIGWSSSGTVVSSQKKCYILHVVVMAHVFNINLHTQTFSMCSCEMNNRTYPKLFQWHNCQIFFDMTTAAAGWVRQEEAKAWEQQGRRR